MVLGVPTIKRERESYLSRTLQSLIDSLNDDENMDCLIVVMICEVRRLHLFQVTLWKPLIFHATLLYLANNYHGQSDVGLSEASNVAQNHSFSAAELPGMSS